MNNYNYWMSIALDEAKKAFDMDEIPVGAVLVKDDILVLKNHNRTNELNSPIAHAEMLIISEILQTEKFLSGKDQI